jgi:pentatricopeptide repeat protein
MDISHRSKFYLISAILAYILCYSHSYVIPFTRYKIPISFTALRERGVEPIKLNKGINSAGFLSNIMEYGKNRMARRAVGILQKMPAYRVFPTTEHYDAALWACANSDQFQLAVSVYLEMRENEIPMSVKTFESMIAVAEKTNHLDDAQQLFLEMLDFGIKGSTEVFNSCLFACVRSGNFEQALKLLEMMENDGIPRNAMSYGAAAMACESAGNGTMALHIMDMMLEDKIPLDTPTNNAIMWACVKSKMHEKAFELFESAGQTEGGPVKDTNCYTAAIWACEATGNSTKAIELLRLIKFDGLDRDTKAFDGVIAALKKSKDWKMIQEVLTWMDRDILPRSLLTYQTAIEAFDEAGQENLAMDLYIRALRENLISPWLKGSRTIDVRGLNLSVAKTMLRNILSLMREKKLPAFNLVMILYDEAPDIDHLEYDLMTKRLEEYLQSIEPINILEIEEFVEDNMFKLKISRDLLLKWIGDFDD